MKKELDEQLCHEFPNLYRERGLPMTDTCMCWGFEFGDGWFQLVYDLSQKLEALILKEPETDRGQYSCGQAKEKFGGMRFYMNSATDEMNRIIDDTEVLSTKTCETCGKPGEIVRTGWWKTTCGEH